MFKMKKQGGEVLKTEQVKQDSDSVIYLKDIYKRYGKHEVLKGVDLVIEKGKIYGLIGKNGAGKSTIFKVILGLSDYTSGHIEIGEKGDTIEEGRHRIGFLIGNNYFPYANAVENLKYYCNLKGIKNSKEEIARVLKLVELEGVKTPLKGFSLGMKQRLGIANAILGNPDILILDEPTNGLDPQGIMDIRKLIRKLNVECGMTVIVSSHILAELQNTADTFTILNDGKIVALITQEDLTNAKNIVRIQVDDVEKAKKLLEEGGVKVLEASREAGSLEDIYFNMIGGGDHA